MTERSISDRHRAILRVINEKLASSGFPPSVREIASAVGLASPSTVKHHLDALEADGYLVREPGLPRALDLTDRARAELGTTPSSQPSEKVVRIEVPVSTWRRKAPQFRSSDASLPVPPSRLSSTWKTSSVFPRP